MVPTLQAASPSFSYCSLKIGPMGLTTDFLPYEMLLGPVFTLLPVSQGWQWERGAGLRKVRSGERLRSLGQLRTPWETPRGNTETAASERGVHIF